ncbi:ATP-binding cassette domain-containing protein [Bradyrhizobium sp. CCGB12]|uniref:ABC transporter ATP-binding protein n=1 Tax=Bradyrhizobium sp. CCGB12 TaxID=2949632 RepID=UPI0020B1DFBB|nr:oligopeptide/dipeptide ABC transporter ATP-binding protein [Bradyrhizobium sp. CCGB12]MCP3387907.1 ATP-binding cassette domain-containing protein [Bradyrhizobium sp. CCGB12]
MPEPLLQARDIEKHFPVRHGLLQRVSGQLRAVDRVSLGIFPGETLGVVGESGCGKSTLGRMLAGLLPVTSGELSFDGKDVSSQRGAALKQLRRDMQFIFQDPTSSLDPRMTVRDIVAEGLDAQGIATGRARDMLVADILDRVGMQQDALQRYPHEFSGGQRQRIGIARALVLRPKLVVADEPVSALDVSVQSQVLNLLVALKREFKLTYVFVAHNLAVVSYISDRIAVMYLGKIVEIGEAASLYHDPRHPYTKALLSAMPQPDPDSKPERIVLRGDVPSPIDPPSGCRFRTRCPIAQELCATSEPALESKLSEARDHLVACHFASSESGRAIAAADPTSL